MLDVAFELHSQLGSKCIAGKVNHKLVPLSQKLSSGDQVEILTSQSQTPKPEWIDFLVTAKAKTALRQELRKIQKPVINRGRDIYQKFLNDNSITETNESFTKLLGTYHINTRDEFFYMLGNGEIQLGDYVARMLKKQNDSLLTRWIWRRGKKDEESPAPKRDAVNTKETYILRIDEHGHPNFKLGGCCNPIPGDEVLGFVTPDNEVEIHAIDCPRAIALKSTHGPRIVTTRWDVRSIKFTAHIHIEGIDRFGILNELIAMISSQLAIDIRKLDIEAEKEVFHCDLWVKVEDSSIVNDLCDKIKKIEGVQRAARIN